MVRFSVCLVAGSGDAVVSFIRFARATRSGLRFAAHQIRAQLLGPALFALVRLGLFLFFGRIFAHGGLLLREKGPEKLLSNACPADFHIM